MELKQIFDEIRDYQYREEGKKENLEREALSYKINLLKVIVDIFYTHIGLMDSPKKMGSLLNDMKDTETLMNDYDEQFKVKYKSRALESSPRVPLNNVNECEKFILSKYSGDNKDFIQKTLWEVKKYYTKEYGMLLNFDSEIFNLCTETPIELLAKIVERIKGGVDIEGNQIIDWKATHATGKNRFLVTCSKNNLNEKYTLLLAVPEGMNKITVSAHFKEQQPMYLHRPNDEMKELLIRFNTLWRDQLSSLA